MCYFIIICLLFNEHSFTRNLGSITVFNNKWFMHEQENYNIDIRIYDIKILFQFLKMYLMNFYNRFQKFC